MICYLFTFAAMAITIVMHNEIDLTTVDKILFAIGAAICTAVPSCYIRRHVRFFEVEADDVSDETEEDSKRVCKKIKLVREIKSYAELSNGGIKDV